MGMMIRRDAEAELNLPPGFRFHPTDEELVVHYLCRKVAKQCVPVPIIAEVDLYKCDPWDLPEKALFGQREWYFFTPRDRKYPNGSRPNRAAGRGYWKATGADKPVAPKGRSRPLGIKKALVFYHGKAPKGVKTDWIMHEYRLADTSRTINNKKGSLRLDDWVLCRLYNKKNAWEQQQQQQQVVVKVQQEEENSDSFQNPESDIELPDLDDHVQPAPLNLSQASSYGATQHQPLKAIKEDNDWFQDLNLDDLQGPFTAPFQSQSAVPGIGIDVSNRDYYFSGLGSPFPRPSQTNIPPF